MTQEMKPEPTDMPSDPVAALGFTPEALDTIEQLATALYAEGQLESALKLFQGLLVLRPDQADAWSAVGAVLTRMEQYEEALPYLSAALALDPDHTPALVMPPGPGSGRGGRPGPRPGHLPGPPGAGPGRPSGPPIGPGHAHVL
jgi:tetratricopeptide (TPR) repeat protein